MATRINIRVLMVLVAAFGLVLGVCSYLSPYRALAPMVALSIMLAFAVVGLAVAATMAWASTELRHALGHGFGSGRGPRGPRGGGQPRRWP